MAKRGIEVKEAFSCSLCGACETACPQSLSPREMFARRRSEAVNNGEIDIDEYRYLFPDRKNNVMNVYRKYSGIDYGDLKYSGNGGICFFPGCTLITYSPELTREIYRRLQESCDCRGIWTECCGKPLDQMGLQQRLTHMHERLKEFLQEHNISRLVVACPGCFYELKKIFQSCDVIIQTVYEVLDFESAVRTDNRRCAIHDACPDRFEGKFGSQVRQALKKCGFSMVEMKHNQEQAICCGSGGQISHFRPDLTEKLVNLRLDEARQSGADILVGYCLSCVLKFDSKSADIPVTHVLNLLLGQSEDFKGAKERAAQMFAGTDGAKIWEEIMAD
jgi:Fe-S oxidoreductase